MSKARTLNPYDMEERIHNLEENGGGGGSTDSAKRSDIATEFSAETSYTAGNFVYYQGTLYIFNVDHAAGAWDAADVAVANVTDEVTSNKAAIDALDTAVSGKSTVAANPEGTATGNMSSIGINGTKYNVNAEYTSYLNHGKVAQETPEAYTTCNLDKTLVADRAYILKFTDGSTTYSYMVGYFGGTQEYVFTNGYTFVLTATTAGITDYSGNWRDVYCDILGVAC